MEAKGNRERDFDVKAHASKPREQLAHKQPMCAPPEQRGARRHDGTVSYGPHSGSGVQLFFLGSAIRSRALASRTIASAHSASGKLNYLNQ